MRAFSMLAWLLACGGAPEILTPEPETPAFGGTLLPGLGTVDAFVLRGRLVEGPTDSTRPRDHISVDELDNRRARLVVEGPGGVVARQQVETDDEGYLNVPIALNHAVPGLYEARVSVNGDVLDTAIVRILAPDHTEPVVRSDADMTWVFTDLHSKRAMAMLFDATSEERRTLPAMEVVYRGLQGPSETDFRPVNFLSGSPRFFQTNLEGRMALDGIRPTGLVLKPMKELAMSPDLGWTEVVGAMWEQVGYKLYWLFVLRTEIPPGTPEILMGDDTEADHAVYALYHRYTAGDDDLDALMAACARLGVDETWQAKIRDVAPKAKAHLGPNLGPVRSIYINETGARSAIAYGDWNIPHLMKHHAGAWPLALDLQEEGLLTDTDVAAVRARLFELGQTDADLTEAQLRADFLITAETTEGE